MRLVIVTALAISGSLAQAQPKPAILETQDFAQIMEPETTVAEALLEFKALGVFTGEEVRAIETKMADVGAHDDAKLQKTRALKNGLQYGSKTFSFLPDGSFKTNDGRILKFSGDAPADQIFNQTYERLRSRTSVLNAIIPRANAAFNDEPTVTASASLILTSFVKLAKLSTRMGCEAFNRLGLTIGKAYAPTLVKWKNEDLACSSKGRFVIHLKDAAFARALANYEKVKKIKGECSRVSDAWALWAETLTVNPDTKGDAEVPAAIVKAYFQGKDGTCNDQNLQDMKALYSSKIGSLNDRVKALMKGYDAEGLEKSDHFKPTGKDLR